MAEDTLNGLRSREDGETECKVASRNYKIKFQICCIIPTCKDDIEVGVWQPMYWKWIVGYKFWYGKDFIIRKSREGSILYRF